jgi:two-component system, OmpR family, response regulator
MSFLEEYDMQVVTVSNQHELVRQFTVREPSLVILDLHRHGKEGFHFLKDVRSRSNVPIIIVSDSGNEMDCAIGLELGADDYLHRPFGLRELVARIRAILRRSLPVGRASSPKRNPTRLRFGQFQLDRDTRKLTGANFVQIALSKMEYALLAAFLDAPQRVLSRDYLIRATRVSDDVVDRSIDGLILRLRRKLERNPENPTILRTERGSGYRFCLPVKTD